MSSVTVLKLVEVDARKIVNDSHSRIVTNEDVAIMEQSFEESGYIPTASPVSVRYATAPEICSFYQGPPHNYSHENAEKLTAVISAKADFDGHVYAYDGLIRKATVLRMMQSKKLPRAFFLRAMLVPQFSPRQAIAYGIAQNSVNGIAVKLSPVEILIKCREYDKMYNSGRTTVANQTEVAKTMVDESVPSGTPDKTKKKQAETRRQIIGVSRKLPDKAFNFFETALRRDSSVTRSAFTIANLKAIPKDINEEEVLCLLSRLEKGYHLSFPKPKPLETLQMKQQATLVFEALRHIKRFQDLAGYEILPKELSDLCSRMTSTQKYDEELKENESCSQLFSPLIELCRKAVPGGDLLMKQVVQKLNTPVTQSTIKDNTKSINPEIPVSDVTSEEDQDVTPAMELNDGTSEMDAVVSTRNYCANSKSYEEDEGCNGLQNVELPSGWHIEQTHFLQFEKSGKAWDERVSHGCDFAVLRLPADVLSEPAISKAVTHLGHALHSTGVGHVYCTITQYGMIAEAVKQAGMYMARDAALYIYDATKVKKLTLVGQTQPIHQCAAVFWREPPSSKDKHYFSPDISCPGSIEPGWVSLVTGLSSPGYHSGKALGSEINCTILRRWCKPGGLCYDATAEHFDFAIAAYDLGIKYVGVEENNSIFGEGKKRLSKIFRAEAKVIMDDAVLKAPETRSKKRTQHCRHKVDPPTDMLSCTSETPKKKKRLNEESLSNEDHVEEKCALGSLCKFKGSDNDPSHVCRCGRKLHNLCDYGRMFPRNGSEDSAREMEFACSSDCLQKYWAITKRLEFV